MSEENKLNLKRARQSSSIKNVEKRPRLAEEKLSSSVKRKFGLAPCPSEKPRATKRVSLVKLLKNLYLDSY